MPLQDMLDDGKVADAVLDYCETLIRVLSGRADLVIALRHRSRSFNAAVVEGGDGTRYTIWLYDGIVAGLREVLEALDEETIDDEMRTISQALLGDARHVHLCYRIWLVQSIVFVVLHELGHVLCGHLGLLAQEYPQEKRHFAFDEIADATLSSTDPREESRLRPLMELEADEFALERMLVLAYEIFCADPAVLAILPELPSPDDVAEPLRRQAEALAFYAACTAMALIEAKAGASPDHPPAFARMFNLVNTFVRRLPGLGVEPRGVQVVPMTPSIRAIFASVVIPSLFNAMDIAETCCRLAGVDLAERFGLDGDRISVAGQLMNDLFAMLTGQPAQALSAEGRRYQELRSLSADFHRRLAPYRHEGA
jgi:hypothetical protein